jgi:hypothetical protein
MASLAPQNIGQITFGGYTVLANKLAYSPKPMGVTLDWSTVAPVQGQNTIGTATITGGPSGGTFTLSYGGQTTAAIAYNATAATVEEALQALSSIGNGNIQVSGAAGGPYTFEFVEDLRHTPTTAVTASGASLTGGTTPGVTIATTQAGTADADVTLPGGITLPAGTKVIPAGNVLYKLGNGKYGVATNATSLVRGECFFNETHIVEAWQNDQVGTVADNGNVLHACMQIGGTGQVSLANFLTAFPAVRLLKDA